jgi:hypothetical protein
MVGVPRLPSPCHWAMRGHKRDENVPVRCLASAVSEIVDNGLTHIGRKREPFHPGPFAGHRDLTGIPIDVVQT